ncbi:hypothetical protein LTR36_008458 [Oleoguttula mirabilis]|uniref:Bacteriophage T5 Orf172 DNA-binding domain-containing protein n=1 Tax=Oleoguttula mirabilis TaxID=1507867 RepID=A0AAV9J7Q4_9PEZI|nr:hypothetical protein LTR36_008458 [Oleoguttula mirabilis]
MPNLLSAHTPEKLLGRNDSKNPAATCAGITSSGRACRRALASPRTSPAGRRTPSAAGVVAVVQEDGAVQQASFYCWQHKDQAEQRVVEEEKKTSNGGRSKRRSMELFPVKGRSSIDTLVQRLGIESVPEEGRKKQERKTKEPRPPTRTETADFGAQSGRPSAQAPHAEKYGVAEPARHRVKSKRPSFWASLCCTTGGGDEEYVEIVRHRRRADQERPSDSPARVTAAATPRIPANKPMESARPTSASVPPRRPVSDVPTRPTTQQRFSSNTQTHRLLSLIPQHLSPQTTSTLLAELIKPISAADEEGYIYIFWLTPQSKDSPAESTARSLLTPGRPQHDRRISDVMTEYSFAGSEPETRGKKTIMLKIGRANNVTRRMNEWQRQCGYALNLVRWYPYISSSSATPSPVPSPTANRPTQLYPDLTRPPTAAATARMESGVVRKVPCVKRVERLVHLELQEKQVKRQCAACGKEHREWFEVEASQAGVKAVDECVRRWVGWAEGLTGV